MLSVTSVEKIERVLEVYCHVVQGLTPSVIATTGPWRVSLSPGIVIMGGGVVRVVVGQDVIRRRSRATVDHLVVFVSTTTESTVVTAAVPSLSSSCRGPSWGGCKVSIPGTGFSVALVWASAFFPGRLKWLGEALLHRDGGAGGREVEGYLWFDPRACWGQMVQLVAHCAQLVSVVALTGQVPYWERRVIGMVTVKTSPGGAAHIKWHLNRLIVIQAGEALPSEEEEGFQTFGIVGETNSVCLTDAVNQDLIATYGDFIIQQ